ncbi:MAG: serine/threonine-protein kinase [Polyangiaceae bacterium]
MALAEPAPGSLFAGDYKIVKALSRGGMGTLYIAEQMSTGRKRALKLMMPELVADPKMQKRFEQEARISAHIASDHVVEVIGAGIDAETRMPWIAMELLQGEDLSDYTDRVGHLPPAEVLDIFAQLCHALGAAHAGGIVHRDLKLANIFLANAKRVGVRYEIKVLDFGIAKMTMEATKHNPTQALGTPLWMAPEQASIGAQITPASDVWSLGLIAFRLLTGKLYWLTANSPRPQVFAMMRELLMQPLESASERAAKYQVGALVPRGFDEWFGRCLQRASTDRFRDAAEAYRALEPVLSVRHAPPLHASPRSGPMAVPEVAPLPPPPAPPPPVDQPVSGSTLLNVPIDEALEVVRESWDRSPVSDSGVVQANAPAYPYAPSPSYVAAPPPRGPSPSHVAPAPPPARGPSPSHAPSVPHPPPVAPQPAGPSAIRDSGVAPRISSLPDSHPDERREIVARLMSMAQQAESMGNYEAALASYRQVVEQDPTRLDACRKLVDTARILRSYDLAFRAHAVLRAVSGVANVEPNEMEAIPGFTQALDPTTLASITHPWVDPELAQIGLFVARGYAMSVGNSQNQVRPDPSCRMDTNSALKIARVFAVTARVLGIPVPALYMQGAVSVPVSTVHGAEMATIVGSPLLGPMPVSQLQFALGYHFARYRPELYVLSYCGGALGMRTLIDSIVRASGPTPTTEPMSGPNAIPALIRSSRASPFELERIHNLVRSFAMRAETVDPGRVWHGVQYTAARVALAIAGNLKNALRGLRAEPIDEDLRARIIRDLLSFWVGEAAGNARLTIGTAVRTAPTVPA